MNNLAHPHAALMLQYAQDAAETDKPWERWQTSSDRNFWVDLPMMPSWNPDSEYRRKPRTINGHEAPEPERSLHVYGEEYYIPVITHADKYVLKKWNGSALEYVWLERGLVHLSVGAVLAHANALLSFTETKR